MPIKKLTRKELKQRRKPWITNEIITLIKRRAKLYKKFIKAKNNDIKMTYHRQYKELRNRIVNLCKQTKKMFYQNFFLENTNNIKKNLERN